MKEVEFSKNQAVYHENGVLRYRVPLGGDYELSIVCTDTSYGGPEGLYEIALMNASVDRIVSLCGIIKGFDGDDVLGFLTEDDVRSYMKTIKEFVKEVLA